MLTGATDLVGLGSKQYPRQEHLEAGMSYGLGGLCLGGPCMSGPPCHVQLLAVKAAVTVCKFYRNLSCTGLNGYP